MPTLHDYIVTLVMTLENIFLVLLIMRLADYRWKEKAREGWTPELWERARKGENIWGVDGGETVSCTASGSEESHMPGLPYRAGICRDPPKIPSCQRTRPPMERGGDSFWQDLLDLPPPRPTVNSQEEPKPTVNSREEVPVRVAVDGMRIECAEADEFEDLDDFDSKAASRLMTRDGDAPIRR